MTEMRLEFPQLDVLLEKLEGLEKKVDELSKWMCPDSFAGQETPEVHTASPVESAPISAPVPTAPAPENVSGAVPTAAPAYTLEQVGRAGADLIAAQPEKMEALLDLLQQFEVPAVAALKPEQLGAFATALRGLGANL